MRETSSSDEDLVLRIREGIRLRDSGDDAAARVVFDTVWKTVANGGDAYHRLFAAHSIADAQDDPKDELAWDLEALDAFDDLTEERAAERGIPGGRRGVAPSLHLNLAQDYARLEDVETAREHLDLARRSIDALDDGAYGRMVRQCFDDLTEELAER